MSHQTAPARLANAAALGSFEPGVTRRSFLEVRVGRRMSGWSQALEHRQVSIYFAAIAIGVGIALAEPTLGSAAAIEPALAVMLFATFLQVPIAELRLAAIQPRFVATLLATNFVVIPVLVFALVRWLPDDPMLRLGALLVLLTPCVDYVVAFSRIGRADARALLAATPVLLALQMLALPVYLWLALGAETAALVEPGPFLRAFLWLIVLPLALATAIQVAIARYRGFRLKAGLDLLPVPATALVLLLVFAAIVPQLGRAASAAAAAVPIYAVFAVIAPVAGWAMARLARLDAPLSRAVAFSAATRNSLVVLPMAVSIPGAMPVLPAVIVAQTVVELVASLIYIKIMPSLGRRAGADRL